MTDRRPGRPAGPGRAGQPPVAVVELVAAALAVVATLVGPLAAPAGAHTDLLQGSPGPGQRVGGTVDFIDLVFVGPVTDVVVVISGPDGRVLDGEMVVADGQIIRHQMEAITSPGRYLVEYDMISEDGDETADAFVFTYEEGALEPFRLGEVDVPEPPSETAETIRSVATIVAVAALAALCVVLLGLLRRRRAELAEARRSAGSSRT